MSRIYERIMQVRSGRWEIGIIENHSARPLTESEMQEALDTLNRRAERVESDVEKLKMDAEHLQYERDEAREKLAAIPEGLREAFVAGAWWHLMVCPGALTHEKAHDEAKKRYPDAALRGEGEPPDPDLNADGPAERAHRQDEARRMK